MISTLLIGTILFAVSVLTALLVGSGAAIPAIALTVFSLALIWMFIGIKGDDTGGSANALWIAFALIIGLGSVWKVAAYDASVGIEIYVIACLVLYGSRTIPIVKPLFWPLLFFAAYLVIATISSFVGKSSLIPSIFQLLTDTKIVAFIVFGAILGWSRSGDERLTKITAVAWIPLALLVAWQWVHPSSYYGLYHRSYGGLSDPLGLVPDRALGPFNHAVMLATFCAAMICFAVSGYLASGNKKHIAIALPYLILLACTTQRVEIIAMLGSTFALLAILWLMSARGIEKALVLVFALIVIGAVSFGLVSLLIHYGQTDHEIAELIGAVQPFRPRPVFYYTAARIASENFPLGSGFATFAGAGAGKFDWATYQHLGLVFYSWFSPTYLFETFWPHIVAEGGWFGLACYLLFVLLIFAVLIQRLAQASNERKPAEQQFVKRIYYIGIWGWVYLFLTSLNGPNYEDPSIAMLFAPFVGIAIKLTLVRPVRSKFVKSIAGKEQKELAMGIAMPIRP